jgi:hypothetical protein
MFRNSGLITTHIDHYSSAQHVAIMLVNAGVVNMAASLFYVL